MAEDLYNGIVDLIQLNINRLTLLSSAKFYFFDEGLMDYVKFCEGLYKSYNKEKDCMIKQLKNNNVEIPEFTIPITINNIDNTVSVFKKLSELEDTFEQHLNALITIAFDNKDWNNFYYLLKKLDTVDHICCRALAAVENKANILALCEQHIVEKS